MNYSIQESCLLQQRQQYKILKRKIQYIMFDCEQVNESQSEVKYHQINHRQHSQDNIRQVSQVSQSSMSRMASSSSSKATKIQWFLSENVRQISQISFASAASCMSLPIQLVQIPKYSQGKNSEQDKVRQKSIISLQHELSQSKMSYLDGKNSLCDQIGLILDIQRLRRIHQYKHCINPEDQIIVCPEQQSIKQYKSLIIFESMHGSHLDKLHKFSSFRNEFRINNGQFSKSEILQSSEEQAQICQYSVGLLQAIWNSKNGSEKVQSYLTAFAISPSVIITCAHGIYDTQQRRACDKAYYIPVNGISQKCHIYKTKNVNFLRMLEIQEGLGYERRPLREDFAVLILEKPLQGNIFLKLAKKSPVIKQKIHIWGYPTDQYKIRTPRIGTYFKREDLKGQFIRKDKGFILIHNMDTKKGHSGSPIFREVEQNGKCFFQVVGIHTHKGTQNAGLMMDSFLRNHIMSFAIELLEEHHRLNQAVALKEQQLDLI